MANFSKVIYGQKTPAEVRAAIQSICEEENYDPFRELVRLAKETVKAEVDGKQVEIPVATVDQKIQIAKEIAAYLAPKIKGLEVKHEHTGGFKFIVQHITEDGAIIEAPASVMSGTQRRIAFEAEKGIQPEESGQDEPEKETSGEPE